MTVEPLPTGGPARSSRRRVAAPADVSDAGRPGAAQPPTAADAVESRAARDPRPKIATDDHDRPILAPAAPSIAKVRKSKAAKPAAGQPDSTHEAPAPYDPRGKLFDDEVVQLMGTGDFAGLTRIDPILLEGAAECGLRSFVALGGFLGDDAYVEPQVLSYEGPFGVGYMVARFGPSPVGEADQAGDA